MGNLRILIIGCALALPIIQCAKQPGETGRINPFDQGGTNWHPPIVTAMADTTIAINDLVPLRATGTDSVGTVVKFLWARDARNYKDTCDSVFWIRFTHAGNDTLLVKAVNNNGVPSVSPDTLIVHVHLYPPVITVAPIDTVIGIGDSLRLRATARDTNGVSIELRWAMDGKNISSAPGDSIVKVEYSSQGTKTVLVMAVDDDSIATIDTTRIFVKDKAPLIFAPQDGAVLQYNSATLKWYPGFYSSSFKAMLDTVSPPKAVALAATRDSSYTVSNLALNKKYYWFVIGYNAQGAADTSQTWSFTTGNGPAVPTNGLVAYYPFNGNANDESGNGNNGTVNGATLTTDRFGMPNRAFVFNGTSDYIDCGNSSTLNVNQHTIALWVWASLAQNNAPCVSKVNPSTFESICLYLIYGRVTTSFAVGTEVNSGLQDHMIPFGRWHFIGMTYDGIAVRFYIDGAKDTMISRSGVVRTNNNPLQIGHHGGDNTFFEGSIDDIRIYNRALTDQEIQALFQEGGYVLPLNKPTFSVWGADSTKIQIQWNSQSGATGYILQSASDSTGTFSQLYSGADTTYSHTGLAKNQKVWYRIKAMNATQASEWSDTAGGTAGQETAGKNWYQATTAATFSARATHTSVVFNNKMWVIGGNNCSTNVNDVWNSADGITWTQATSTAGFRGRNCSSLVFDNQMWVIGGWIDASPYALNDVWNTSDGITWTQVTPTAAFSGRADHASVVFNNKMWIIGGNNGSTAFSDVWYSSDGVTWTLATSAAAFGGRSAGHTCVAYDNKMWVIGGTNGIGCPRNGQYFNDVWYSSDGVTWTQATGAAPFNGRAGHTSVVYDNKMWIIGGTNDFYGCGGGNFYNDAWYTTDGISWTQTTLAAAFSARYVHTSVVLNNKIWVIAGGDSGGCRNDVWYTGHQ